MASWRMAQEYPPTPPSTPTGDAPHFAKPNPLQLTADQFIDLSPPYCLKLKFNQQVTNTFDVFIGYNPYHQMEHPKPMARHRSTSTISAPAAIYNNILSSHSPQLPSFPQITVNTLPFAMQKPAKPTLRASHPHTSPYPNVSSPESEETHLWPSKQSKPPPISTELAASPADSDSINYNVYLANHRDRVLNQSHGDVPSKHTSTATHNGEADHMHLTPTNANSMMFSPSKVSDSSLCQTLYPYETEAIKPGLHFTKTSGHGRKRRVFTPLKSPFEPVKEEEASLATPHAAFQPDVDPADMDDDGDAEEEVIYIEEEEEEVANSQMEGSPSHSQPAQTGTLFTPKIAQIEYLAIINDEDDPNYEPSINFPPLPSTKGGHSPTAESVTSMDEYHTHNIPDYQSSASGQVFDDELNVHCSTTLRPRLARHYIRTSRHTQSSSSRQLQHKEHHQQHRRRRRHAHALEIAERDDEHKTKKYGVHLPVNDDAKQFEPNTPDSELADAAFPETFLFERKPPPRKQSYNRCSNPFSKKKRRRSKQFHRRDSVLSGTDLLQ